MYNNYIYNRKSKVSERYSKRAAQHQRSKLIIIGNILLYLILHCDNIYT